MYQTVNQAKALDALSKQDASKCEGVCHLRTFGSKSQIAKLYAQRSQAALPSRVLSPAGAARSSQLGSISISSPSILCCHHAAVVPVRTAAFDPLSLSCQSSVQSVRRAL
jgi:hypothetical protein